MTRYANLMELVEEVRHQVHQEMKRWSRHEDHEAYFRAGMAFASMMAQSLIREAEISEQAPADLAS